MVKRKRVDLKEETPSNYFTSEKEGLTFLTTGCTMLDCAMGGGYVLGRIANVIGDKSTAKTALGTEALINFKRGFPRGAAAYRECESAYDLQYAEAMGLPTEEVDFGEDQLTTIEEFTRDLDRFVDQQLKAGEPGCYVLDSLDSLSDEAEMERDIGKGTYGMEKAKILSIYFRKSVRKIEAAKVLVLIVSQIRDNIGVMIGRKHKRAGGKALDFYATHAVWLARLGDIDRTVNKIKRPVGIKLKAMVDKNKIAFPHRHAEFEFVFGYGVEDLGASVAWLLEVGRQKDIGMTIEEGKKYLTSLHKIGEVDYVADLKEITPVVKRVWAEVETTFLPIRKKYA